MQWGKFRQHLFSYYLKSKNLLHLGHPFPNVFKLLYIAAHCSSVIMNAMLENLQYTGVM